jgi:hypothetical protein
MSVYADIDCRRSNDTLEPNATVYCKERQSKDRLYPSQVVFTSLMPGGRGWTCDMDVQKKLTRRPALWCRGCDDGVRTHRRRMLRAKFISQACARDLVVEV